MKIHDCIQDDDQWHKLRAQHYTASEAPAMMGVSKYQKRSELLNQKATAIAGDVDAATQARFDRGHASELGGRLHAERIIGEDLFPATVTEEVEGLPLLASLDGMTVGGDVLWEHKLYSEELAAQIKAGKVEPHYAMQMEQQLMVTGADKVLFMCSDGTEERCEWMWYTRVRGRGKKIIAGWKQFEKDLAEYQPVEEKPTPQGRAPETLPALHIKLTGLVEASNLAEFKQTAMALIGGVSTDLQTDADFADAEKAVKWCGEVESRLEAAKQHALSQTASIDELFRTVDEIKAEARAKRLELEKLVKRRKEAIRVEIQKEAADKLIAHYEQINATLKGACLKYPIDFTTAIGIAMKGKKTVASLRDAADTALAQAKIDASEQAELTRINLQVLEEHKDYASLFPDFASLATTKAADDFKAIVTSRIAEHKAAEDLRRKREEEERQAYKATPVVVGVDPAQPGKDTTVTQSAPQTVSPAAKHPAEPQRPTDEKIIGALCDHFNVSAATVVGWLRSMNLDLEVAQ